MKALFTLLAPSRQRLLLLWLAVMLTNLTYARILLVKTGSSGGTRLPTVVAANWNTAAYPTLRNALAAALSGDQIWVATGTYYPDEGSGATNNNRSMSFVMKEGVAIYGGFAGTETTLAARNWATYVTILSGEIQQDNNISNNAYHVIFNYTNGLTSAAVLDGFVIRDGSATEGDAENSSGGGMFCNNASPQIVNCIFTANEAVRAGGAFLSASSASFINCVFLGNEATNNGGAAIQIQNDAAPSFLNCTVAGNKATEATVFMLLNADPTFTNCIVWGNSSGIFISDVGTSVPTYNYSLIEGLNPGGTNLDGTKASNNPNFVSLPDFNDAPSSVGDLRLNNCSPAIDAGNDDDNPTTTDLGNNNRKKDIISTITNTIDLGAYEYQLSGYQFGPIYVNKAKGNDFNTGNFWSHPLKSVTAAIQTTCPRGQIWVVAGTYYPDEYNGQNYDQRNLSFIMKEGVAIYGGFPDQTDPPTMTDRNWATNITTLSGEIQQDNNIANNAYHVIDNDYNGLTSAAVLDGFVIREGSATGDGGAGGGMVNAGSSPQIVNCIFTANEAGRGGGSFVSYSSASFTNCVFLGNKGGFGAALNIQESSNPTLLNCTFAGNQGSVITMSYNAGPTFTNCIVWGNESGISNEDGTSVPTYNNSLVQGLNLGGVFDGTNAANDPLFTVPPIFSNAPTSVGSVSLQACSPVINMGQNTADAGLYDLARASRIAPFGGNIDLGAYEYQSTASVNFSMTATPTQPTSCTVTGSIKLSGLTANRSYIVTYKKDNVAVAAASYTANSSGEIALTGLGIGSYTEIVAMYGRCSYVVSGTVTLTQPNIIYVNTTTGNDTNNGTSWGTAFKTLRKALSVATCKGLQIWVAAGIYYPDDGPGAADNDRNMSFVMKEGVKIYGGFAGTESNLNDRHWANNVTTLSGEIQQDNNNSNNAYHVIFNLSNDLTSAAVLDGFVIREGSAGEDGVAGGGMVNVYSSPQIVNCIFTANEATIGGGVYLERSSPSFTNCVFLGNKAGVGAALQILLYSNPTLLNCTFAGNQGIAIYIELYAYPTFTNCLVWGNSSGISIEDVGTSVPTYNNSLIQGLNPGGSNLDGTNPANNPLFVSQPDFNAAPTTAGDLRLQACSPAINAGAPTSTSATVGNTDVANKPRFYNNGTVDLGAYEYQGTASARPTASTSTPSVCIGNTINLSASGGSNFSWAGPSGSNFSSTAQNPSFTGNVSHSGLYTVSVYNANCPLSATATVSVQVNALPTVSISPPTSQVCVGASLSLSATASLSKYSWASSGGTFTSTSNQATFSSNTAGGYSFTVTASNGTCTNTATASVLVNPNASISTQPASQTLTEGSNLTLSVVASNATVYQWQKDNANFGSSSASPSLNLGAATFEMSGTYKVLVSGICGTVTSSPAIVTVTPSVSFASSNGPVCIGLVIDLKCQRVGTGYTWLGPDGWTSNLKDPSRGNATAAMGGVYSVSVKSGGVVTSATTSVVMVSRNSVSASSNSPVLVGNAIQLSANGGAAFSKSYAWTGPSSFSSTLQNPTRLNAQLAHKGKYIVTFNGACGTATASTSVVVNSATRIASSEDEAIDMEINAYPNPVTNILTVEVRLAKPAALTLELFNGMGQKNGYWKLSEESTHHKTELDLSSLTGGMYLLQAQAGKQKVVKRVVKIQY